MRQSEGCTYEHGKERSIKVTDVVSIRGWKSQYIQEESVVFIEPGAVSSHYPQQCSDTSNSFYPLVYIHIV